VPGLLPAALTVPAIASARIAATTMDNPNILNFLFMETSPFFYYLAVTLLLLINEKRGKLLQNIDRIILGNRWPPCLVSNTVYAAEARGCGIALCGGIMGT
jgi:hypothetical protein